MKGLTTYQDSSRRETFKKAKRVKKRKTKKRRKK